MKKYFLRRLVCLTLLKKSRAHDTTACEFRAMSFRGNTSFWLLHFPRCAFDSPCRRRRRRRRFILILCVASLLTRVLDATHGMVPVSPDFSSCTQRPPRVHMIWSSSLTSFDILARKSVESILKHSPCTRIIIYSDNLPASFFAGFRTWGYDVEVVGMFSTIAEICLQMDEPGCAWFHKYSPKSDSIDLFQVHSVDVFRLMLVHKYGGSYVDFDQIFTEDVFSVYEFSANIVGTEVCMNDNPDCVSSTELKAISKVVRLEDAPVGSGDFSRASFHDKDETGALVRYTPCNGVLLRWQKRHPFIATALKHADGEYDANCWGCLGPRLFGSILRNCSTGMYDENLVHDVSVLPPGVLYAYDYRMAGDAMRKELTDQVYSTSSVGMHLYSSIIRNRAIKRGSTVDHAVQENGLFPPRSVKRSSGCVAAKVVELRRHMSVPKSSTFPSHPVQFAFTVARSSTIFICHPGWLGIREATEKLSARLSIPIVMLTNVRRRATFLGTFLRENNISHVVFHGGVPGSLDFIENHHKDFIVSVVYHSGLGVLNSSPAEVTLLGMLHDYAHKRMIALRFLESDQTILARLIGSPSCTVLHVLRSVHESITEISLQRDSSNLQIGLLGVSTSRSTVKNLWPQLMAACLFEEADIHVTFSARAFRTLSRSVLLSKCKGRLINHGLPSPASFETILGNMHINLYISATEAIPNVVVDSLRHRVPVLTSDTTELFNGSQMLKELLIVNRLDDTIAIHAAMMKAIAFVESNGAEFQREVSQLLERLESASVQSWIAALSCTRDRRTDKIRCICEDNDVKRDQNLIIGVLGE